MRRRALLILGTMLLGVMLLGGAALAKTITGTNGPDRLIGTPNKDRISGLGGADYLAGRQSADQIYAGRGRDEVRAGNGRDQVAGGGASDQLYGGGGNDTINARDGYEDAVNCGTGTDTAYVDRIDRVNRDCENVFRAGGNPKPGAEKVAGKGELGGNVGNPRLQVNAKSTGTNPIDAEGTFSITYPDATQNNPQDTTEVDGDIVCLAVTGNEAQLVGQINFAGGPKAEGTDPVFRKDQYVRMGVLDNRNDDKANFSAGEPSFKSCNGEDATLDVVVGNFVVKENS
jgi:Ca2+-binding RTX toxin-like protein